MTESIASLIRERRTIHQFKDSPTPGDDLIQSAIDHAIWAPNHHLSQPWHFYLPGQDTIARICTLNAQIVAEKKGEKAAKLKHRRWLSMPGWLVLTVDRSEDVIRQREDYAACCCVAQNLALYLWNVGVGLKWTTGAVTRDERFFDILDVDFGAEEVVGLFWYGYPQDIPAAIRKDSSTFIKRLP